MSFLKRLFGKAPTPEEQFVQTFRAALSERGVETTFDPATFSLTLTEPPVTAHLENYFAAWSNTSDDARGAQLARFTDGLLTPPPDLKSLSAVATDLVPALRTRASLSLAELSLQAYSAQQGAPSNVTRTTSDRDARRPFASELDMTVVVDLPASMIRVSHEHLLAWGSTFEAVEAIAMSNLAKLRALLPCTALPDIGPGVFGSFAGEDHQISYLALPPMKAFDWPDLDGPPVVLPMTRNQMLLTGLNNEAGLIRMLDFAQAHFQENPHPMTLQPFVLDADAWRPFVPTTGSALANRIAEARTYESAYHYAQQKAQLEALHQAQGADVHVGDFQVFSKEQAHFSVATWVAQVSDGLLPKADRLAFVDLKIDPKGRRAPEIQRSLDVAWDLAVPIVGDLMQPTPDLYPPRYRVTRFPDESLWPALEAAAKASPMP